MKSLKDMLEEMDAEIVTSEEGLEKMYDERNKLAKALGQAPAHKSPNLRPEQPSIMEDLGIKPKPKPQPPTQSAQPEDIADNQMNDIEKLMTKRPREQVFYNEPPQEPIEMIHSDSNIPEPEPNYPAQQQDIPSRLPYPEPPEPEPRPRYQQPSQQVYPQPQPPQYQQPPQPPQPVYQQPQQQQAAPEPPLLMSNPVYPEPKESPIVKTLKNPWFLILIIAIILLVVAYLTGTIAIPTTTTP